MTEHDTLTASMPELLGCAFDKNKVWARLQLLGITDTITLHRLCREMKVAHGRKAFMAAISQPRKENSHGR